MNRSCRSTPQPQQCGISRSEAGERTHVLGDASQVRYCWERASTGDEASERGACASKGRRGAMHGARAVLSRTQAQESPEAVGLTPGDPSPLGKGGTSRLRPLGKLLPATTALPPEPQASHTHKWRPGPRPPRAAVSELGPLQGQHGAKRLAPTFPVGPRWSPGGHGEALSRGRRGRGGTHG